MIDFILQELRRQGVAIPDAAGTAAMVATCSQYGGERMYVPKLPKLQTAVRIQAAQAGGALTAADLSQATGLSVRHVKAVRRRR